MNKLLILFFAIFLNSNAFSQSKISKIFSKESIYIFNNIKDIYKFEYENYNVRIYSIVNLKGKNITQGTDEKKSDLFIAISEIGEYPKQKLFKLSNIYLFHNESFKLIDNEKFILFEFDADVYIDKKITKKHFIQKL